MGSQPPQPVLFARRSENEHSVSGAGGWSEFPQSLCILEALSTGHPDRGENQKMTGCFARCPFSRCKWDSALVGISGHVIWRAWGNGRDHIGALSHERVGGTALL